MSKLCRSTFHNRQVLYRFGHSERGAEVLSFALYGSIYLIQCALVAGSGDDDLVLNAGPLIRLKPGDDVSLRCALTHHPIAQGPAVVAQDG